MNPTFSIPNLTQNTQNAYGVSGSTPSTSTPSVLGNVGSAINSVASAINPLTPKIAQAATTNNPTVTGQNVAQGGIQTSQVVQFLNNLKAAGYNLPTSTNPQNFTIPNTGTISSSSLNPNVTGNDVQSAVTDAQSGMSSSNTAVPSDSYVAQNTSSNGNPSLSDLASQIYGASQYTPEELQGLQNYSDITNQINATTLAARTQINQMLEDGTLTTQQAQDFTSEAQRRSDVDLANLATAQSAQATSLGVLGQIRGNQLSALQNVAGFLTPTSVAPGNSLITPTGQVVTQGTGAAPATLASLAQQLYSTDVANGRPNLNQDGSVNWVAYGQQAQQMIGAMSGQGTQQTGTTGVTTPQVSSQTQPIPTSLGVSSTATGTTLPQGQTLQTTDGGTLSPEYSSLAYQLPTSIQGYVSAGPQGVAYISSDKVPAAAQGYVQQQAARVGIPYLTTAQVGTVSALQSTYQALDGMSSLVNQTLGSGIGGTIQGNTLNPIEKWLGVGNGPALTTFSNYRTSAINAVKAIANGTGGLRINTAELDAATDALPTIRDNTETANAKLQTFRQLLNTQLGTIFPAQATQDNSQSTYAPSSSGSVSVGGATFSQNAQGQWVVSQ